MTTVHRIVSGMRPTGPLHLGHYFGVLQNWIQLQQEHNCYFFIADWHALTSEYGSPQNIASFVPELLIDWIAAGLDPQKSTIFRQSDIMEHAELNLLLGMITPLGWLERNPTYKEIKQELVAKDLNTFGFLGYPVLMTADILMYHATMVPVGQDQLPHLELCREIARRFNYFYGSYFPEPQAQLTESAKLPGLDGRKMSKSYGNAISLGEDLQEVRKKIMSMLTDTARQRLKDPGDPDNCNLFPYLSLVAPDENLDQIREGCTQATRGCMECKKLLAAKMEEFLTPIQAKRNELKANPDLVRSILDQGTAKAREEAQRSMHEIRDKMGMER
ncbi:tryptophan--tRNA ligase [Desulfovermiculus halophilus]|jgi:tryptophanyl-tRNA synthetase|uniref:tryptophan--tRNA ligase n=1 Tax=Desulfovermiculus halophilus TaxID=339722 RepID=UPI0004860C70|nr:tryptophan--tRNA ligase [Desulfovermiculus halophilus]